MEKNTFAMELKETFPQVTYDRVSSSFVTCARTSLMLLLFVRGSTSQELSVVSSTGCYEASRNPRKYNSWPMPDLGEINFSLTSPNLWANFYRFIDARQSRSVK